MKQRTPLRTLLLFSLIFIFSSSRAQYVSIPDTAFGHALYLQGFASCMTGSSATGWHLDTICSAGNSTQSINVQYLGIHSVSGLQYLSGLDTFTCYYNQITTLPKLPSPLKFLYCGHNQLSSLPTLPSGLTYLDCSENTISNINSIPATLVALRCYRNALTAIPSLPSSMILIDCSQNHLTSLPTLPASMQRLYCNNNSITALPSLPGTMIELFCYYNSISTMPVLPSGLRTLSCDSNRLTVFPTIPGSVTTFSCSYNHALTTIPNLPDSLYWFHCTDDPALLCLPTIHKVVYFDFSNSGINCLPNHPQRNQSCNPPFLSLPFCGAGNTNGCSVSTCTGIGSSYSQSITRGSGYNFGGHLLLTSGVYHDTLASSQGCDSVVTLTLTVVPIPSTVNIPDHNFAHALDTRGYAPCMTGSDSTGWYLDTLCAANRVFSDMYVGYNAINDISGIQYLKNLTSIDISGNQFTTIPGFPSSLRTINAHDGNIGILPPLPDSLQWLNCNYSHLGNLPPLPNTLTYLDLGGSNVGVTSIPALPDSMYLLDCSGTAVTCMPTLHKVRILYLSSLTQCIPNYPQNDSFSYPPRWALQLCSSGNTNGCAVSLCPSITPHDTLLKAICYGSSYFFNGHAITTAGIYSDSVISSTGCDSFATVILTVNPPIPQTLCLVTVDTGANKPFVIWEKADKYATDSFLIYRTNTPDSNYTQVGAISRDSLSVWEDTSAHPEQMSYRYKLAIKDTCGHIDSMSAYHQTIYLSAAGLATGQFSWTPYMIEDNSSQIGTYAIYRDAQGIGAWLLLSQVPYGQNTFNDTAFASYPNAQYKIVISLNNPCNPTRGVTIITSNVLSHANTTGIQQLGENGYISISPNPVHDICTMTASATGEKMVYIYDAVGQLVYLSAINTEKIIIDFSEWGAGVYFYQIQENNRAHRGKIIKE